MIDPTNPRVIQDAMRAMAGQSYGFLPTMLRQIVRVFSAETKKQTPVFDRIVGSLQPAVIRGLSQQSRIAAENFVPTQTVQYVSPNILGPDSKPMRLSQQDVDDGLAAGVWTPDYIQKNFKQEVVGEETPAPERLNLSQVDHVIRTMLRGAEAMGISAERLAAIDWASVDLETILQGAVENGEFRIDLSNIPGLDDEMREKFRTLADSFDVSGLKPVVDNTPFSRKQRVQASEEPAPAHVLTTPAIHSFDKLIGWLTGTQRHDNSPRKAEDVLSQATRMLSGDKTAWQPGEGGSKPGFMARAVGFGIRGAAKAGQATFNILPKFVKDPITKFATQAGITTAQSAGLNTAGQAAAGAASGLMVRVAAGLHVLSIGLRLASGVISGVVGGLIAMSKAAWATTQRVIQYNGALQAAQAVAEMRTMVRNYQMGDIVSTSGANRMEQLDNLEDVMLPLEASIALFGNTVGAFGAFVTTGLLDFFNNIVLEPLLIGINNIVQALPLVSAETKAQIREGTAKIVNAIEKKEEHSWVHPTGGPNMMAAHLQNMMPGFNMGEPEKPKPFHGAPGPAVPNLLDPNRPFNPNPFGAGPFGR